MSGASQLVKADRMTPRIVCAPSSLLSATLLGCPYRETKLIIADQQAGA